MEEQENMSEEAIKGLVRQYDLAVLQKFFGESELRDDLSKGLERVLRRKDFISPSQIIETYISMATFREFSEKTRRRSSGLAVRSFNGLIGYFARKKGKDFDYNKIDYNKIATYGEVASCIANRSLLGSRNFGKNSIEFVYDLLEYVGVKVGIEKQELLSI